MILSRIFVSIWFNWTMISESFKTSRIKSTSLNESSLLKRLIQFLIRRLNQLVDWSSSWVFIPTFWLAQVLDINVVIQLKYLISISWFNSISISSRVRTRWLDSTHQAIKYDVKRVKYRNFSGFSPLHYLFALSFW